MPLVANLLGTMQTRGKPLNHPFQRASCGWTTGEPSPNPHFGFASSDAVSSSRGCSLPTSELECLSICAVASTQGDGVPQLLRVGCAAFKHHRSGCNAGCAWVPAPLTDLTALLAYSASCRLARRLPLAPKTQFQHRPWQPLPRFAISLGRRQTT